MSSEPPGSSRISEQKRKRRLSGWLTMVFVLALIMGPGPGALLVRPPPGAAPAVVLGMPILYVWTVFWFFVMATIVLIAARFLWPDEEEGDR